MGLLARFLNLFFQSLPLQGAQEGQEVAREDPEGTQVKNGGAESDGAASAPAVSGHMVEGARFAPTSNKGAAIVPQVLVIHFTANGSVSSTVKWFQKQGSEASAHLVIGRDGELVQMVPFHLKAWHAGESQWLGRRRVNDFSIGIELVNWGRLNRVGERYFSWASQEVPAKEAVEIPSKDGKPTWWHIFPDEQIEVCANISRELVRTYKLADVLGHFEISPGRKSDPGPAFPLEQVRAFCYSDAEDWKAFTAKNKDGK